MTLYANIFWRVIDVKNLRVHFGSMQVMLDTMGPELQILNKTEQPITLEADTLVVITPDLKKEASSKLLPINFNGLSKVSVSFPYTMYVVFGVCTLQYYSVE